MKSLALRGLGFVLLIYLMMQSSPLVSAAATKMFGKFEEMADSIIYYDENGDIQMNGQFAENTLDKMGENAQVVTGIIGSRAESILNAATDSAGAATESAQKELTKINELGEMLIG